jgi:DNA-binding XRE family transcriptional regulator
LYFRITIVHPLKREFIEHYKKSGWTQAEAARQLELTRGGVNGIITGPTVPSLATVKLFKLLLESQGSLSSKNREGTGPREEWAEPLLEELRKLEEPARARLLPMIRELVKMFVERGGKSKRAD